jgi:hypothetical protein
MLDIIFIVVLALVILTIGYLLIEYSKSLLQYFLEFVFSREIKAGIFSKDIIKAVSVIAIIIFVFIIIISFVACSGDTGDGYYISGAEGKIVYKIPDTIKVNIKTTVRVRIARKSFNDSVFLRSNFDEYDISAIPISRIMEVVIKETSDPKKLTINLVNNHVMQIVDSLFYTEWIYDITAHDYGPVTLSISASIYLNHFGRQEPRDIQVYHKDISIYATKGQQAAIEIKKHYLISSIIGFMLFLLLYRLIPQTKIIQNMDSNSKRTNYWNSGSMAIVIYIITIISLILFRVFEINIAFSLLVFVGTLLIYLVIAGVALRDSGQLTERNFLKIIGMVLKKVPPLNLFFKDSVNKNSRT